jgi:DNA-binding transcriptional ArsR family regulator
MTFTSKVVDDLETLKAVSHPLRLEILGRLRNEGPATASQLGRELGESSGSTSYHLRQLERFGFVTDDDEQPSGRERRWRALHDSTSFPSSLADLDGGREYVDAVRRRQEQYLREGLEAWTEHRPGIGMSDYGLRLDLDDLQALQEELHAVVTRYAGRGGSEDVVLHVLTLPRPAAP